MNRFRRREDLKELIRGLALSEIRLHAASSCYFMVLAVFPGLLLLLGLVQLADLNVEQLGEMFSGVIPDPFLEGAKDLIRLTYDRLPPSAVGLSALTTLWPASRGIYGILKGLNGVYGVRETRGWLHTRLLRSEERRVGTECSG